MSCPFPVSWNTVCNKDHQQGEPEHRVPPRMWTFSTMKATMPAITTARTVTLPSASFIYLPSTLRHHCRRSLAS
jgi:hypothetical protein